MSSWVESPFPFPLLMMNYSSIKNSIKIASDASACNEIKNVATPIDNNNSTPIPDIETYNPLLNT